jgi:hypothetical protein
MFFGVMFGRLLCMVFGMNVMPMSDVRVMARRLMFAFLIIPSRLLVMFRGVLVMFGCFFVMFCAFVCRHLQDLHALIFASSPFPPLTPEYKAWSSGPGRRSLASTARS